MANDTCSGAITVDCNTDVDVDGTLATINGTPGRACSGSGAGLWYTFEGDGQTWNITVTPQHRSSELTLYPGGCDNHYLRRGSKQFGIGRNIGSLNHGGNYLPFMSNNETRLILVSFT
ncbi:MAG: hypothetical protein R2730_03470 [Chitinophagales bacterium]